MSLAFSNNSPKARMFGIASTFLVLLIMALNNLAILFSGML